MKGNAHSKTVRDVKLNHKPAAQKSSMASAPKGRMCTYPGGADGYRKNQGNNRPQ